MATDFTLISSSFSGSENITTSVDAVLVISLMAAAIIISTLAYYFAFAPQKTINKFLIGILSVIVAISIIPILIITDGLNLDKKIHNFSILPMGVIPLIIVFAREHMKKNLQNLNTKKVLILSVLTITITLVLFNINSLMPAPALPSVSELKAVKSGV